MITYYKLLDMLNRKGMTKEQLRLKAGLASGTMTKISKQEPKHLFLWESKIQHERKGIHALGRKDMRGC